MGGLGLRVFRGSSGVGWKGPESSLHSLHLPRISRKNQKKGPGIARAGITGVGGSVGYAAFQNPISVLP